MLPIASLAHDLSCPHCGQATAPHTMDQVMAPAYCAKCQRLWLAKGQLAILIIRRDDFTNLTAWRVHARLAGRHCLLCKSDQVLTGPYEVGSLALIDRCQECEATSVTLHGLGMIRRLAVGLETKKSQWAKLVAGKDPEVWACLLTLPMLCLVMPLLRSLRPMELLLDGLRVQFHQFGHLFTSLLSGRALVPAFLENTATVERSFTVYFLVWGLFIFWGWLGHKKGRPVLLVLGALGFLLQNALFFRLPEEAMMWIQFGGTAAEFVVPTLLLLAFFYQLPDELAWKYWRFPVAGVALFCFQQSHEFWSQVAEGVTTLPIGSLLGGSEDVTGDVSRLINLYGWKPMTLSMTYVNLARGCVLLLWSQYLASAWLALLKKKT